MFSILYDMTMLMLMTMTMNYACIKPFSFVTIITVNAPWQHIICHLIC